jgi:hypothetical protein
MDGRRMRKCLDTKETPQAARAHDAALYLRSVMWIVMNCPEPGGDI